MRYLERLDAEGYALAPGRLPPAAIDELTRELEQLSGGKRDVGLRDLLTRLPALQPILAAPTIRALLGPVLGSGAFAVRALLFDKLPAANWAVAWHQDLTIAVKTREDVAGFASWTIKQGIHHVQPTLAILQDMLTLRLHLDPADKDNGGLLVAPGSHALGRIAASDRAACVARLGQTFCAAERGDVIAFRPLLLHASRKGVNPSRRRVIQVEFASKPLPPPLQWHAQ
jgi:ectoine hydroxylase-related dioxygenase (phytanoyl-CoA dioxygenase family)